MTLEAILHWLADQAGKLAGKAETDAVHTAISDLLGGHTAPSEQAPAASPVQATTPEAAAPVPDTVAESPAAAAIPPAHAPYPGPPASPVPEG